jgi:predicted nucleic acid-binding protein
MTLLEEIQATCTVEQIAEKNYHVIAAAINANRTGTVTTTRLISERGILESYSDGALAADAVLAKLEAFSLTGHPMASIVKRAMKFLGQAEGLDIGSATTQALITALGAGGVLTVDEAAKLNALAPTKPVDKVTWEQCQTALGA